jgi:predicted RNA methylase
VHINPFSNPWEHVRLLSDASRNRAMIDTVVHHSAHKRVLEVGCGTGLLSCIAARAGATRVYAVEATDMVYVARDLVRRNGLQDVVEVIAGMVEDVEPRPVDFAFSELLHGDPFTEGVVGASNAMARWVVEGGLLSPSHLTVYAALVPAAGPEWEVRAAEAELARHSENFNLDLGAIAEVMRSGTSHVYNSSGEVPVGPAVEVYRVNLGDGKPLPPPVDLVLEVAEAGPVSGVMVWFVARMDEHTDLGNPPRNPGHWGHHVCAFGRELEGTRGQRVAVRFQIKGKRLEVELLDDLG